MQYYAMMVLIRVFSRRCGFRSPKKKRQDIQYVGDYLLIDDFYSELRRRNSYLRDSIVDEAKVIKLNKTCLEAAEKTLKDIDWNKYR